MTTKRVTLFGWSSKPSRTTSSPCVSPAIREAMAATAGSPSSAISRAAPAVSKLSTDSRPRPRIRSRHWRRAWGWLLTRRSPPGSAPGRQSRQCRTRWKCSPDDVQARVPQQVVDEGDPASERVVDGDHRARRALRFDDLERLLESGAREGVELRPRLAAGGVRVRPGLPLIGDAGALARTGHRVESRIRASRPVCFEVRIAAPAARRRVPAAHSIRPPLRLGAAVGRTGRETLKA